MLPIENNPHVSGPVQFKLNIVQGPTVFFVPGAGVEPYPDMVLKVGEGYIY